MFGLMRQHKNILSRRFDILIDGYPRSANTYAVHGFKASQHDKVRISSHHHNPAAVIAAIKMRKPVLVLARDPVDAVASWTVFSGYPLSYNFETYINYYAELMQYVDRFVIGTFPEVTHDFPRLISRINEKFGEGFSVPTNDSLRPGDIFNSIARAFEAENGEIDERRVSRPSIERDVLKRVVLEGMYSAEIDPLRQAATELYVRLSEFSMESSAQKARSLSSAQ